MMEDRHLTTISKGYRRIIYYHHLKGQNHKELEPIYTFRKKLIDKLV